MKSQHVIGGALLKTTLVPAEEGNSRDCTKIAGQLQIFLSLLDKAYACAVEDKFDRFLEAFSQEVDDYLDELIESLMPPLIMIDMKEPTVPPEVPGEMEEFMEKMAKRKKKNLRKK